MIVWTNNRVAFARDMIFGICVMTETGWYPVCDLNDIEFALVMDEWGNTPGNPYADSLRNMEISRRTRATAEVA